MCSGQTSRRDDLISLFYLLIFMLNGEDLFVGGEDPTCKKNIFGVEKVFAKTRDWKSRNDLPTIAHLFNK